MPGEFFKVNWKRSKGSEIKKENISEESKEMEIKNILGVNKTKISGLWFFEGLQFSLLVLKIAHDEEIWR